MNQLREMYLTAYEQIKQVLGKDQIDFLFEQFKEDEKAHIKELVVSYLVENKQKGLIPNLYSDHERIYKLIQLTEDKKLIGILMYPN
ncbi:MAG: hypothetical protein ABIR66_04060 [Saprospiraceae bacterium]